MKFRQHKSTLAESVETMVELKDREALVQHCKEVFAHLPLLVVDSTTLKVESYADFPDQRVGWDETFIVTLEGKHILGFCDSVS